MFRSIVLSKVLITFIFLSACVEKEAPAPPPPPEIEVVEVQKQDIPIFREYIGQIYGEVDIPIRARVEGFLEEMHFDEGFPVRKGQLLYVIDSQPFEASVASQRSRLAEAKTELVRAESELARYEPLVQQKAVSQSDYDATKAQYEAAQASVEAAEANLELELINLSYTKINSPIAGFIGKTKAKIGEFVGRSPNPVILNTVSKASNIRVEFFLTEAEYLRFVREYVLQESSGQYKTTANSEEEVPLELILADGSLHKHKGKVDFVDREVVSKTGSLLVQATFPNPNNLLKPGQFAKIRAKVTTREGALLIPQRSVSEMQGQFSIFVVKDNNEVEFRRIVPGEKVKDMWVIEDGLDSSDKVVLSGVQKIKSGMEVNPVLTEFDSHSSETESE